MAGAGAGIVQARSQSQDLDQQRQVLAERRREIEERTLASSERGLGLLYESEKVGGLLVTSSEALADNLMAFPNMLSILLFIPFPSRLEWPQQTSSPGRRSS